MRFPVRPSVLIVVSVTVLAFFTSYRFQHITESAQATLEILVPESPSAPQIAQSTIGPVIDPPLINPLTGLVLADAAILKSRPVVVKISNAPPLVRPQAGLNAADLVFEHYVEGGLTRFSAIFYSQAPTRVGSIRSARLIDYELAPMYQALLAFSGGSLGVEKRIFGSDYVKQNLCANKRDPAEIQSCGAEVDHVAPGIVPPSEFAERAYKGVLYGPPYFWRDETIPVPHNLFVNVAALQTLAKNNGQSEPPKLHGMSFAPSLSGGEDTPTVEIRYRATLVRWVYDETAGRYKRFSDGQPHFDVNTNTQVSADNVVIIYTGHYLTDIVESVWQDNVSWSTQITIWPEGDAVLLRDGKRYEGRWVRAVREDLISLQTYQGENLPFKPGNTWFQLVQIPELQNPQEEWVKFEQASSQ